MSNATPANRKVTMQTSALKSQKTSGKLDNLHIGDLEKGVKIRVGTLHLVSRYFQRSD